LMDFAVLLPSHRTSRSRTTYTPTRTHTIPHHPTWKPKFAMAKLQSLKKKTWMTDCHSKQKKMNEDCHPKPKSNNGLL
jgi:hypothetical protein